jgi:hypothetical protein
MTIRKFSTNRISTSRSFEKTKTAVGSSVSREIKIEYLVVGGGGGASDGTAPAQDANGAGGGGGVVYGSTWLRKFGNPGTSISIQVGAAGSGTNGTSGTDSSFGAVIGYGGGAAGPGGSGGASGNGGSSSPISGASTQISYPDYGGTGYGSAGVGNSYGGGAGGVFSGIDFNISGSVATYSRGGRIGVTPLVQYSGYGHGSSSKTFSSPYTTNPGPGVVILRYLKEFPAATATTGSPTVTIVGDYRIYTFTSSGSITF